MKIIFFLFSFLFSFSFPLENPSWILEKNSDGIQVFTRKVSNLEGVKEFKSTVTIDAPVDAIVQVVHNLKAYPEWMFNIKSAERIKRISEKESIAYYELSTPWPISNRDVVLNLKTMSNATTGVVEILITCNTSFLPEKEGIVRMPETKGKWLFTPLKNGKTEVLYQLLADPAGSIPVWIINLFAVDGPYESLLNLRKRVEKSNLKVSY